MIRIDPIIRARVKKRRSRSPTSTRHSKLLRLNNPLINYKLFNKEGYNCPPCNRAYKCKEYGSKDHKQLEYILKEKKKSWQLVESIGVVIKKVKVVKIASLATRNNPYQFIHDILCFSTPLKHYILIKFRLVDACKPLLINLPLPLKPSA